LDPEKRDAVMKNTLNINESFICRIWESRNEFYSGLKTTDGEPVKVINYGMHNSDSGPDYKNALVQIGAKTYSGDIEIHRDFKGWHEHSHKKDSAYNSVILQVILWGEGDRKPELRKKRDLPTIILSDYLNRSIHEIWQEVISNPSGRFRLPCYGLNSSISLKEMNSFLLKLSIERLKMKSNRLRERLKELESELSGRAIVKSSLKKSELWNQLLYEFIFEALGYSKNKEQMLKLAQSLKLSAFNGGAHNELIHLQALLFGCSGLLFDLRIKDNYVNQIKSIWSEWKDKITSEKLIGAGWKFFRLRPQNFPTIRIAYGSQLINKIISAGLLKNIILQFKENNYTVKDCYHNLSEMLAPKYDRYWSEHYNFGKKTEKPYNLLGKERINDIIVNVLVPLVYLYSEVFSDDEIRKNVMRMYTGLRINPKNSVLNLMSSQLLEEKGIGIKTPAAEQGVIHLYNFYCMRERCSECKCGKSIVKDAGFNYRIIFY
jgi:hypothetical protein